MISLYYLLFELLNKLVCSFAGLSSLEQVPIKVLQLAFEFMSKKKN